MCLRTWRAWWASTRRPRPPAGAPSGACAHSWAAPACSHAVSCSALAARAAAGAPPACPVGEPTSVRHPPPPRPPAPLPPPPPRSPPAPQLHQRAAGHRGLSEGAAADAAAAAAVAAQRAAGDGRDCGAAAPAARHPEPLVPAGKGLEWLGLESESVLAFVPLFYAQPTMGGPLPARNARRIPRPPPCAPCSA